MNRIIAITLVLLNTAFAADKLTYPIVDTGQDRCFDDLSEMQFPTTAQPYFGQDAHYRGNQPVYRDNNDGTITDLVTGLMWQKNPGNKKTYRQALADAAKCRTGGYDDWRMPGIKELYSLILFTGEDPDPMAQNPNAIQPFIDTRYFDFSYGNVNAGERIIDSQFATATRYLSTTMGGNPTVFGVNFADGRIKGYPIQSPRGEKQFYTLYVRGNKRYGQNKFVDNGDGTVTDAATGLIWMAVDSGHLKAGQNKDGKLNWAQALQWAETLDYAGHTDWRLPNAKELHSLIDYTRCPDATNSPALDPIFKATPILNEGRQKDYAHYWTSTTHIRSRGPCSGVYICFGRGLGFMQDRRTGQRQLMDVHGAGCQRSDPKVGDPAQFPFGRGPQGDVLRIYNMVRCVRGGPAEITTEGPALKYTQPNRPNNPPGRPPTDRGPLRGPGRRNPPGQPPGRRNPGPNRNRPLGPRAGRINQPTDNALKVITIGTGSPLYNPSRSSLALMIEYQGRYILVDMGDGTARHLHDAGFRWNAVAAVCFTHHNRDHNADAMEILPLLWQRGNPAPIYGPTNTQRLVSFLHDFFKEDIAYRTDGASRDTRGDSTPTAKDIAPPAKLQIAGLTATVGAVDHSIETLAWRFDSPTQSVVISGDLSFSESLIELADGCDMLVMDSGGIVYEGMPDRPRQANRPRPSGAAHASLEEVATMAAKANAKKLVLVHFRPGTVDEERTLLHMKQIYSGDIIFAQDMQTHEVN